MDLILRGGRVVTPTGQFDGDVGVENGRIAQLGGAMHGGEVVDASGLLVLPGGVDLHVHLTPAFVDEGDFEWADDFASGTAAALAGGVTTIGNVTFPDRGEGLLDAVRRIQLTAEQQSSCDFVLHPVILHPPADPAAYVALLHAAGCVSVKWFTHMSGFAADPAGYVALLHAAGEQGLLSMVHCEDGALSAFLSSLGSHDPATAEVVYCPPAEIETAAVQRVTGFARAVRAPVHLVHLAHASSLDAACRARASGAPVSIETRPEYLLLDDAELAAAAGAGTAGEVSARGRDDLDRLWTAIATGELDAVCTDHAPWRRVPARQPASSLRSVRSGLSCLEWSRSLLFSRGVAAGRISLEHFVAVTATNPARLFGLAPAKGAIVPGADADLVLFDAGQRFVVDRGHSAAAWSPFLGWELTGRTVATFRRGELVYRLGDGAPAAGGGRRIGRGGVTRVPER